MPSIDTVVTDYSLDDIRDHTMRVCEEIAETFGPLYFIWGEGGSGEHAEGRALDFMTYELGGGVDSPGALRVDLGWQIANYLWEHRSRLGVWYVMYRKQIISVNDNGYGDAGEWNDVPDRGDPTANHMDHPHVSFEDDPPTYRPIDGEDDLDMSAVNDLIKHIDKRYTGLREYMAQRTTARISEENAKRYGYTKTKYQASAMAADASWRTRAGARQLADLSDAVLKAIRDVAELVGKGNAEQKAAAAAIVAELEAKCAEAGTVDFAEPDEIDEREEITA